MAPRLESRVGEPGVPGWKRRRLRAVAIGILGVHVAALAWSAAQHSPSLDEPAHLAAGMSHWQFGRFDLFRVNPPLVRMVAAVPVLLAGVQTDWSHFSDAPEARPEFVMGLQLAAANGPRTFWLVTLARWACIPFSVLGAWICYLWARELYGEASGIAALCLWCFDPNILANGQMIAADAGAAAVGAAAVYSFWRWLRQPTWARAVIGGFALGLAELTKLTWTILFPLYPLLWLAGRWSRRREPTRRAWLQESCQLGAALLIALWAINAGYGFSGSFRKLGDYRFVSSSLGGFSTPTEPRGEGRNRWSRSWLGGMRVPLPKDYVLGIDLQKCDFERGRWSYLRGEWRFGGWWYYYLYALAIKVPLGTWVLILVAFLLGLFARRYAAAWQEEIVLIVPMIAVLTLVSSHTNVNHHLRYVLPAFPLAFVLISRTARALQFRHRTIACLAGVSLLWSVGSSLFVYPHSLSYFNEVVGGPTGGHAHLGGVPEDSNIDCGQDLLYLKRWLDQHPEARPLGLAVQGPCDPALAGIAYTPPPPTPKSPNPTPLTTAHDPFVPQPGWYALSVNRIRSRTMEYEYFFRLRPVAMAGYSIYIYHVTGEGSEER